jgi:restriction system protein
MARTFVKLLNAMARESARAQRVAVARQRAAERAHRQIVRAVEKAARDADRAAKAADRDARRLYIDGREAEVRELNRDLNESLEELSSVLQQTLGVDDAIDFDGLRMSEDFPKLLPPASLTTPLVAPDRSRYFLRVSEPSVFSKLFGGQKRYEAALAAAEQEYAAALAGYEAARQAREAQLQRLSDEHAQARAQHIADTRERNHQVTEFERAYRDASPDAIVGYHTMVLERSSYPEGFPHEYRVALVSDSRELVVEYELPSPDVVPTVLEYRYAKTKDAIESKPRKDSERREIYADVVAGVALRTCHEAFEADRATHLALVTFNGFVQAVDPATGVSIRPHLISVRATREQFERLDLSRVDKRICLRNLGAAVSPRPTEVQPIKPIIDFNMVDKRFVEESDILSDLESRPNLMDLDPFQFENLVSNLFKQMGLETRLTRSSRDGGVDVVAYDVRPVLGGKVVIQAKRYRHTVGVSAVRDLYGTMVNEGANKGILVTTSGFGPDAFEFAKDKPIELIQGGQLLYLLKEVGVEARIVMPDEVAAE